MEQNEIQSLKEQIFGEQTPIQAPAPEAQLTTDLASQEVTNAGSEQPVVETAPTTVVSGASEEAIDDDVYIKQHFGDYDRNSLKAALEELKQLKESASTPAEYKFASEEAKRITNAINSGDWKTVRSYAEAQELSVEGMTPEQQLKTYIKLQNPLFDQELIEDEYSSNYMIDETDDKYIDNPLQLRKDKLRMEQRKQNDLQNAQKFFSEYKTKIELPDIAPKPLEKDEQYETWKAEQANLSQMSRIAEETYSKLSPNDIASTFKFNDEANKFAFDLQYVPDTDSFKNAIDLASNGDKFFSSYIKQDGSPDNVKFAKDLYNGRNIDKVVTEAMKQTFNQTMAWFLKNQKNIGDGAVRNYTTQQPSEIDSIRQQVFGKVG